MRRQPLFLRLFLILFAVLAAAPAQADPPARVGRLALVENGVNFRVDRDDEGGPASINWPISSGAVLESERRGRAEVWVGSTAFRLAGGASLAFPVLDDREVSLQLQRGTLAVSILDPEQSNDVTVQTPEGRIRFATPGRFRIDVFSDHTELTAQAGQAVFNDGERNTPVRAGQKASLYAGEPLRIAADYDRDAFDYWVGERENAALASQSRRHVSPAMTGYQDLDAYGDWQVRTEYGAVWYPRSVADDWAPYRVGRWAWVAPWGWTWVDQAPWGFAPFHYGRWVQVRGRWGWAPGTYVARPVYAPALVAWIGNPGWSASFSFGAAPAVGWFPLAPREVYVPGFHASSAYVHRVNHAHIRDMGLVDRAMRNGPPQSYVHRALPQAVTVVPSAFLREGRPINAGDMGRHERRDLERVPQVRAAPDNVLRPPAGGRQLRDESRRDAGMPFGEGRSFRRDDGPRQPALQGEPRSRDGMPAGDADGRRRDVMPGRLPERSEDGRRPAVVRENPLSPQTLPAVDAPRQERDSRRPGFTRQEREVVRPVDAPKTPEMPVVREERRPAVMRENPSLPSAGGDMPRQDGDNRRPGFVRPEREIAPPVDAPRTQEMPVVREERRPAVIRENPSLPSAGGDMPRQEGDSRRPGFMRQEREVARPVDLPRMREMPVVREERRPPVVREAPAFQPAAVEPQVRQREIQRPDFSRQEREMPRPVDVPRQREMPQAAPQPMRAPMPQAAPAPAREAPPGDKRGERRRERDER
ncbi:DUF6600 domain-containing protein [Quatrionicoccus australiensis]|uniref:DUF6600 domain-containing protein n=1 Tax=Quatrionicoccus australiensis TaxID=138118 RepID=UPI001CF98372|nr:DUF6600 domain-containing protein [Quatrionicoccus australiensis]MCB4359944.1 hypothetical protein [Quatrionicoccus australiensis]